MRTDMKTLAFMSAIASVVCATHAMAGDYSPPLSGTACDRMSVDYLRTNGDKGLRVKLQSYMERDGTLRFMIHDEAYMLKRDKDLTLGGLDGIDASNIDPLDGLVKQYGVEPVLKRLDAMADSFGAWLFVVPNNDAYMAFVLIRTDPEVSDGCLTATENPMLLDGADVPAKYMQR